MGQVSFLLNGVVHDLLSRDKYDAIHELINKVKKKREIRRIKNLENAVLEREKLQSTGVGEGVAIAHGKSLYAEQPLVMLGISRDGIQYDSPDGKPVNLLFLIANHPDRQKEYLSVLSTIARIAGNAGFREKLLSLASTNEQETFFREMFSQLAHQI